MVTKGLEVIKVLRGQIRCKDAVNLDNVNAPLLVQLNQRFVVCLPRQTETETETERES